MMYIEFGKTTLLFSFNSTELFLLISYNIFSEFDSLWLSPWILPHFCLLLCLRGSVVSLISFPTFTIRGTSLAILPEPISSLYTIVSNFDVKWHFSLEVLDNSMKFLH